MRFHVEFLKEVTGGNGHVVTAVQGAINVDAPDASQAVSLAKHEFCAQRGIRVWSLNADRMVVEARPPVVVARPSHRRNELDESYNPTPMADRMPADARLSASDNPVHGGVAVR